MNYNTLLNTFKDLETEYAENVVMLIDDVILRNGVLAWQSMMVEYNDDVDCPEACKREKQQWEWMWSVISYDYKKFASIAGIKDHDAATLIDKLRLLRLIYPDGTSSETARKFIREQLAASRPGYNIKLRHALKSASESKKVKKAASEAEIAESMRSEDGEGDS